MTVEARPHKWLVLLVALIGLTACRVQHDNPPRPLNAQYHQLPQVVVDRLLKEVPPPPNGSNIDCRDDEIGGQYWSYCICYGAQGCRELAEGDRCDAKIGEVRPGIGVCKQRIHVTVVG